MSTFPDIYLTQIYFLSVPISAGQYQICRPTLQTSSLCSTITHTVWAGFGLSNNTQTRRPFTQTVFMLQMASVCLPTLEMSSVLVRMLEDMSTISGTSPVSGMYWNSTPVAMVNNNNNMITISHVRCIYPCYHGEQQQQHDYHQSRVQHHERWFGITLPSFLHLVPNYHCDEGVVSTASPTSTVIVLAAHYLHWSCDHSKLLHLLFT